MGAGIAAQIVNGGVDVLLLDIVPEEGGDRSTIAKGAIEKLLKADPAPLMHRKFAKRITPGNIKDDLDQLAECDWIIEAVIENLEIKHSLYGIIAASRKPGAIVSSNTSTIPLNQLTEGMAESLAADFMITHFFNPPRYMRLLELVSGPLTRPEATKAMRDFVDRTLGKSVVDCNDTPGFIANRIGIFWLQCAVIEAMDRGLSIEEADAVIGRPAGIPRTGVFGLLDLIGLDLMPKVLASMSDSLGADDPFHGVYREPELIERLIADGYTGRKGKGGFYRLNREGGKRIKEAIDLGSGEYAQAKKPKLSSVEAAKKGGLKALLDHSDRGGKYAWAVWSKTLSYAASLVPEIADDIAAVDEAMRLGYNWKFGPFELIDKVGVDWFAAKLAAQGNDVPSLLRLAAGKSFYRTHKGTLQYLGTDGAYTDLSRAEGVLLLADIKRRTKPVAKNMSASLWNIGDGVLCLEFHSRMNALDPFSLFMVDKAVKLVPRGYKALVIHNEGRNFSVGANIGIVMIAAKIFAYFLIGWAIGKGQRSFRAMKYAPFPVVAAPSGMALGGGCEVLLHSDAVQAHGETYAGLVEVGVGLVPGWGGCKEMLLRWAANPKGRGGPMPPVTKVFEIIGLAAVAKSAEEARDLQILRDSDSVTMNRDRVLADAKARALALAENYAPPEQAETALPGPTGRVALEMAIDGFRKSGKATPHDVVVSKALARVVSGGETDITEIVSEDDLLALERESFLELVRHRGSKARIAHMLKTGKPLRN
ncbi:MAG: 3-hydroxyacyl-CoA dehydrogenase [Rhodospirillaceae bacterium]|nr:3-hydroxyacyl-CoA dehydrogenase [Rhodospirillaceae bacterium]